MKGVILAGGTGSRLYPLTKVTNKHLLPIYAKPMIYYPIQTLIDAGVKDILIVSGGENISDFLRLLGSGADLGVRFTYRVQDGTGGIAAALYLAKEFVNGEKFVAILGDNVMEGSLKEAVKEFSQRAQGAHVFVKEVPDPHRFGIAEVQGNKVIRCYEKPENPITNLALLGFYFLDGRAFEVIPLLEPSARGEKEITDVLQFYADRNELTFSLYDQFWIDAGTFKSLFEATKFAAEKELKKDADHSRL